MFCANVLKAVYTAMMTSRGCCRRRPGVVDTDHLGGRHLSILWWPSQENVHPCVESRNVGVGPATQMIWRLTLSRLWHVQ